MADSHIFADAFNYLIYNGEQVIHPEDLHTLDTTAIAVPYGADGVGVPVQKYRDELKYLSAKTDESSVYLILGIENQSDIHYAMPVRNMVYDALQYAEQVNRIAAKHRRDKHQKSAGRKHRTSGEYLTGFYKDDRLVPVITLVIYFGPDQWDGPTTLHDMLEINDPDILAFVPDYKINLIAPALITKDEMMKLTTSLREVLLFIKYSKDKNQLQNLLTDNKRFQNIDRKAVQVINTVTHSDLKAEESEDGESMCIALDQIREEYKEEGRMEGRREGRAEGRKEGLMEGRREGHAEGRLEGRTEERIALAVRMLKTGEYSISQIAGITLLSEEEIETLSQKNGM